MSPEGGIVVRAPSHESNSDTNLDHSVFRSNVVALDIDPCIVALEWTMVHHVDTAE